MGEPTRPLSWPDRLRTGRSLGTDGTEVEENADRLACVSAVMRVRAHSWEHAHTHVRGQIAIEDCFHSFHLTQTHDTIQG